MATCSYGVLLFWPHGPRVKILIPVAKISDATGLDREVVRKWESRYGFPNPIRDAHGDRVYPADQVSRLQLIRRLLDAGKRPSEVVGLEPQVLEQMVRALSPEPAAMTEFFADAMSALLCHDPLTLADHLKRQLHRQGLFHFVRDTIAPLTEYIGEAWLRGEVRVFEEHQYAKVVGDIMQASIHAIAQPGGSPRILLATQPGERHVLGLTMAEAVLSLGHASCVNLGAQVPISELIEAAEAFDVDVVGLSFSIANPLRETVDGLRELRGGLNPAKVIWAGGGGMERVPRMKGVTAFRNLDDLSKAVAKFRSQRTA